MKTPLNLEQIITLKSHFRLEDFIRTQEPFLKKLELCLNNELYVLNILTKEPSLMQRPIVTFEDKAIIGRPPETVLKLFD